MHGQHLFCKLIMVHMGAARNTMPTMVTSITANNNHNNKNNSGIIHA